MRLIKPSVEIFEQGPEMQGIYNMIELCGKTSYKSPVKGGEDAEKFVSARANEGHLAVLEFGTVYLKVPPVLNHLKYEKNPYSKVNKQGKVYYVTTNYRVIVENGWEEDLKWMCEPTEYHYKRYTAKFITDRGVTHELVRHRVFSFCQESTRYCNYSKDKFGNELTCIVPDKEAWKGNTAYYDMLNCLDEIEKVYLKALEEGVTPQIARGILPNILKTEICVCGFEDAWKHFFELRYEGTTGKPHPSMLEVATLCYNSFKEKGIQF